MISLKELDDKLNNRYTIEVGNPQSTLQLFITSRCNIRCQGCFFFEKYLGHDLMDYNEYINVVNKYKDKVNKIILIGGEPTLHPNIKEMITYNYIQNLKTTVYTNGINLKNLPENQDFCSVRIGVSGFTKGSKPFNRIPTLHLENYTIVYMLQKNNIHELITTMEYAHMFGGKKFMISSMCDVQVTGDFWEINKDWCLTHEEYLNVVIDTLKDNSTDMEIHICGRGQLDINSNCNRCRYANFYPELKNGTICPFDISLKVEDINLETGYHLLGTRKCNKHSQCLLQKVIVRNKES